MRKCAAITASGTACKGIPIEGSSYCYVHSPETAEERKAYGRKGGKRGGRGRPSAEIHAAKGEIRRVIDAIEAGDIETKVGTAMFQGWNLILRALDTERNIRETEELAEQVRELWEA